MTGINNRMGLKLSPKTYLCDIYSAHNTVDEAFETGKRVQLFHDQEQICQLFPQSLPVKWNCPKDCQHSIPSGGSWDNPEVGGCAVEDKLPAGATLEPDTSLPLCPFYKSQPLDDKATKLGEGRLWSILEDEKAKKNPSIILALKRVRDEQTALLQPKVEEARRERDLVWKKIIRESSISTRVMGEIMQALKGGE